MSTSSSYTIRLYPYQITDEDEEDNLPNLLITTGHYAGELFPYAMLHDPDYSDRVVLEPKLEIFESKAGSLTFTVTQENALYAKMRRSFDWEVMVFRGDEFVFAGFPVERETDLYGFTKFTCEGVLGFLNLVYLPGFNWSGDAAKTIGGIFHATMELYNNEIAASTAEYTGERYSRAWAYQKHRTLPITNCRGFSSSGTFNRYTSKSLSAMEILQTRLVDYFHGLLYVKPVLSPDVKCNLYTISYTGYDTDDISGQEMQVGVNVQELSYIRNREAFYTAIVPVNSSGDVLVTSGNGAQSGGGNDEDGNPIAYRRANSVIFRNRSLVNGYGLRVGLKTYNDEEGVDTAQMVGTALNDAANLPSGPTVDITVKALDVGLIDGSDAFRVGQYVHFNDNRGQQGTFRVSEMTLQLDDPTQNQITITGIAKTVNERWW